MPAIRVDTIAQVQLIPGIDPLGMVGFASVVKTPAVCEWTVTLSAENGSAGSPDFLPLLTPITGAGVVCFPRIYIVGGFPPAGPVNAFLVRLEDAAGAVLPDFLGAVVFRLDRKYPGS